MTKIIIIFLIGIAGMVLPFSQSEENRDLEAFTKVHVHESIDVYLTKGNKESAKVVAGNVDISEVLTEVRNGRLTIHLDGDNYRKKIDVTVYVTYVDLEELDASSAGSITVEDKIEISGDFIVSASSAGDVKASIKANSLKMAASSSGDIEVDVEVENIKVDVSSAGDIEIKGTTKTQTLKASSSGDYNALDLESTEVVAKVSSGGSILISVSEKLYAKANSGGRLRYKGSPKYVDVNSNSGGSVKQKY